MASEEEEEGDRSTSASSPSGGLRRPFLPGSPPKARSRSQTLSQSRWGSPPLPRWQSPWPSCASLLPALGTPWLSLTVLAFFAERFPLAGLVSARCAPKSVRLACPNGSTTRPATHFVVGSKFVFLVGRRQDVFCTRPILSKNRHRDSPDRDWTVVRAQGRRKPSQFLMRDVTMANFKKTANRNCQHGGGRRRSSSKRKGLPEATRP